ncbi:MAG: prolyl oligopeptidase family serine peptidase [Pseudomonadota bacterium]
MRNDFRHGLRLALTILSLLLVSVAPSFASPSTDLFGQTPGIHDADLSPDGTRVAVIQAIDGDYVVRILSLAETGTTASPALKLGEGVKPRWIRWANNDRVLTSIWRSQELFTESSTGSRFKRSAYNSDRIAPITLTLIYTIDARTMEADALITPNGLRQYNDVVLDWLEDDPDHILMAFAGDGNDQLYPDVRRVHVAKGTDKIVHRKQNGITDWVTATDGTVIAGSGFTTMSGKNRQVIIRDPGSGDFKDIDAFPGLDLETDIVAGFSDLNRLVIRAYRDKHTLGLHIYDLTQQAFTETLFHNDQYDVGRPLFSGDGTEVVGASYIADTPVRTLLPGYGQLLSEVEGLLEGYTVDLLDRSEAGDKILVRVSSTFDPGGLYLYESGKPFSLLGQTYPGLDAQSLGMVAPVRYTAQDGTKIPAYVTLPTKVKDTAQIKDLPFIVLPHGGPYARDYKRFDWLAQMFAANGYGVLQMNFRGSVGYGAEFERAGREDWTLIQSDVRDGAQYLLDKGYADPDRMCIAGWSFGGYAALMGAANDPELYQCVIAIGALTDVKSFYADQADFAFARAQARRFFGNLLTDDELLKANSPVNRAEDITAPTLLAHGTLDSVVEHSQFVRMRRNLKGRGHVDLSYPEEDHYFSAQSNRQDLAAELIDFVEDHLGKSQLGAD